MAEVAATPPNGVTVNNPAVAPAPAAAPAPAPAAATEPAPQPTQSWFSGFDWFKVLGYTVLTIVGVSYIKYTRDKAKKDNTDIADIKSQLSKIQSELNSQTPA